MGIDFGTSYSSIAVVVAGQTIVIPTFEHYLKTPTYVSILDSGQMLFGFEAKKRAQFYPESTFYNLKRFIGHSYSDPEIAVDLRTARFKTEDNNGQIMFCYRNYRFTTEQLVSFYLNFLKITAERFLNVTVSKAVIAVPIYFTKKQQDLLQQAAFLANITVMQFIPEPSAAALYFLRNGTSRGHDIVFDFGGGTLDISLLRRKKNTYSVVDFSGSDRLGGEDFDYNIKNYLNISDRDWVFNKQIVEQCKIQLSSLDQCNLSLFNGSLLLLKRDVFEELNNLIVEQSLQYVQTIARQYKIDNVILVGGTSRVPMINIRLQSLFPNSKLVLDSLLDSAVSHGASIIANEELSKKLSDISPMNIGFCNKFGEMDVIIHRNSKIPVSFKLIKVVYVDYENISIYQGINKLCQFNQLISVFLLHEGNNKLEILINRNYSLYIRVNNVIADNQLQVQRDHLQNLLIDTTKFIERDQRMFENSRIRYQVQQEFDRINLLIQRRTIDIRRMEELQQFISLFQQNQSSDCGTLYQLLLKLQVFRESMYIKSVPRSKSSIRNPINYFVFNFFAICLASYVLFVNSDNKVDF